ncbi:MAG: DNA primase [Patescibacteria group bacterium]
MSDSVQQIKDRLTIVDVISPYVELHKAGRHYKGKSPFSPEKTPSFYVSPDKGMYYCFSTNQGGDMFTFVEAMEGVDFKEALKILAGKAGVELVPENPEKKNERERQLALIEEAVRFFESELKKEGAALEYLLNRGVTEETIKTWRIGFAPGPPKHGWRHLKDHLEALGYKREEILKAGLIKTTEGGKEPFDVFRDRVMFPMAEQNSKVVAFSGRILSKDSDAPKYVNSPETELYKKSELLFGYDKAKHGIRNLGFSLIVEGQFDVVMCHQSGYGNTVAVSGTALTQHHVMLLERLSDKVVLALDADRAGIAAVKKASELMLRRGLDIKVAKMPEGKDPADIVKDDVGAFKKIVGASTHVIEYLFTILKEQVEDERTFKLRVREEILPYILLIPNKIDQEHFAEKIAEGLGTSMSAIRYELERLEEQKKTEPASQPSTQTTTTTETPDTTDRIKHLQHYLLIATTIMPEDITRVIELEMQQLPILERETLNDLDAPTKSKLTFTIEAFAEDASPLRLQEDVIDKLTLLRSAALRSTVTEKKSALQTAEQNGEEQEVERLLQELQGLQVAMAAPAYSLEIFSSPTA